MRVVVLLFVALFALASGCYVTFMSLERNEQELSLICHGFHANNSYAKGSTNSRTLKFFGQRVYVLSHLECVTRFHCTVSNHEGKQYTWTAELDDLQGRIEWGVQNGVLYKRSEVAPNWLLVHELE